VKVKNRSNDVTTGKETVTYYTQEEEAEILETERLAAEEHAAEKEISDAFVELENIDLKSIRPIREFLIMKFSEDPDLPTFLSEFESKAKSERKKIR